MIYSTNRTTSLGGYFTIDVNESYFGAGSLDFMEENAKDELELFEMAIKSDIDECLIGESSYEIEALNEGFIENAINKIKELMKKFVEWIKSVFKSIIAKLSNLILRDNKDFCKKARKMISQMKNRNNLKYSGKALAINKLQNLNLSDNFSKEDAEFNLYDNIMDDIKNEKYDSLQKYKKIYEDIKTDIEDNPVSVKDILDEFIEDVVDEDINFIYAHIDILEQFSKKKLEKIKKSFKSAEDKAKRIAKNAEKASKKANDHNKDGEEGKRELLSLAADVAALYKKQAQSIRKDSLKILKKIISVARAVVTKVMGVYKIKENVEYTDELVQAMIETADFELDEIFEETSEGKECDSKDDDFEDDDEE